MLRITDTQKLQGYSLNLDDQNAIKNCTQSIDLNPISPALRFNRAMLYLKVYDIERAKDDFALALELCTDQAVERQACEQYMHAALGIAYEHNYQYLLAVNHYLLAIELYSSNVPILFDLNDTKQRLASIVNKAHDSKTTVVLREKIIQLTDGAFRAQLVRALDSICERKMDFIPNNFLSSSSLFVKNGVVPRVSQAQLMAAEENGEVVEELVEEDDSTEEMPIVGRFMDGKFQ